MGFLFNQTYNFSYHVIFIHFLFEIFFIKISFNKMPSYGIKKKRWENSFLLIVLHFLLQRLLVCYIFSPSSLSLSFLLSSLFSFLYFIYIGPIPFLFISNAWGFLPQTSICSDTILWYFKHLTFTTIYRTCYSSETQLKGDHFCFTYSLVCVRKGPYKS